MRFRAVSLAGVALTCVVPALARAQTAGTATEPVGPPSPTLSRPQSAVDAPVAKARPSAVASPSRDAPAPEPAAAPGQAAAGVTRYPAAFFAPSQPNTAADMIDRLPGFVFDDGDSVRGFGAAAGNVLIDGERPASKNDDLNSVLRRIPANQVERIDLIRGGAPGVDMQGKTVLANVIRKSGPASSAVASVSQQLVTRDGRQTPGLRLEGTRRGNGRSLEGSLVLSGFFDDGAGDGPRITRDGAGAVIARARDDSEADGTQDVATAAYERPLFGGKLRLNAQLFDQHYFSDESVQALDRPTPDTVERDHQDNENGEFGLHYTRALGKKVSSETVLLQTVLGEDSLSLFQTDPANGGEIDRFREQHFGSETVGRETLTWTASRRLTVEAGGEAAYNYQDGHTRFVAAGVAQVLPAANVVVDELRGEAFAKASWTATRTLTVEAGMRVEASHIGSSGDVVLSKVLVYPKPRLALTWSPTKADQIRFRVEREVGQLNFSDFTASSSFSTGQVHAGNPDLTPQQSWVVEAAYERRFLGDGAAVVTVRHAELTDVIDRAPVFSPTGAFDTPANIGSGTKDELVASLNLPLGRFHVPGGLIKSQATFRRSSVTDPTTGEDRGISGLKPFEGQFEFSQDLPKRKLTWGGSLNFGFRQTYYYFNQVEVDQIRPVGGVFAEYRPTRTLSLRAELNDIGLDFDRRISASPGVRAAGQVPASVETRELDFGPIAYVRLRRTW